MSETERLLSEILSELKTMNGKLDAIIGEIPSDGTPTSLSDIYNQLFEIQGYGPWNSISDIYDKIEELTDKILADVSENFDKSIDKVMGTGLWNTLSDIYDKISD